MALYLNQRREIENVHRRLTSKYGADHPAVKTSETDLENINTAIDNLMRHYLSWRTRHQSDWASVVETERLQRMEMSLAQSSREANLALDSLTRLKRDIQDLRDQADQEKQNRDDIKKRIETQERVSRVPGRVRVIDTGNKPTEPAADSRPRLASLLGLGGVALGIGAFVLVGLFDGRVRGIDDARRTGLGQRPLLGLLPNLPPELSGPQQLVEAGHCVHQIRTMLQVWYGDMNRPVFAITGPAAGSGKTTLTLALGLSFAAAGARTLLIDLDLIGGGLTRRTGVVRRPRLGQLLRACGVIKQPALRGALKEAAASKAMLGQTLVRLGLVGEGDLATALATQGAEARGVLDALNGLPLTACVCATEYPKLSILSRGKAAPHHAGTISPLAIQGLLDTARTQYDVVLIDTGPLPGSLEASAAVTAADGVVVTVSRGDARTMLHQCTQYLRAVGARVAGVVLNRASQADVVASGASSSGASNRRDESGVGETGKAEVFVRAATDAGVRGTFGPFGMAIAPTAQRAVINRRTIDG
jgi:Mrp family chromosome partitioning ATPase